MNALKEIVTKLQTATVDEVAAILDAKVEETGPQATVDYVGMALGNIDDSIARIKEAKATLNAVQKEAEAQAEIIKIGAAKWLAQNGIDKLNGMAVSSMTINETASTDTLIIEDEEAVIGAGYAKLVPDTVLIKKSLQGGIEIPGARLEITHNEPKIKLNKRRKKSEDDS